MPEIKKPTQKLDFKHKLLWTGLALVIYIIMTEIPLYGVFSGGNDPFLYSRIIFASSKGTLMELGIGPIVTAGLIIQLLKGAEFIKLDFNKPGERALFTVATKLLTIVITIAQAAAFMAVGVFGQNLSQPTILVIFSQLVLATIIVMLMDEMIQKGWGLGSGISLFIAAGVTQQIFWSIFSPFAIQEGSKSVTYGILPYLVSLLMSGGSIADAFFRSSGAPTLIGLFTTIIVGAFIIYIEGVRLELPIAHAQYRGFRGRYPVKLLYVSVIPVILASAMTSSIYMVAQIMWARYNVNNTSFFFNILGKFDPQTTTPIGGLAYYVTPPAGLGEAMLDPFRALSFVTVMVVASILFAKVWVEVGGLSARNVSKQLIDSGMQIPGFRRRPTSISHVLNRFIPTLTVLSGFFVGLIAGVSQILGVFGSGTGLLLTIGIIIQYHQILMRERVEDIYPGLGKILK